MKKIMALLFLFSSSLTYAAEGDGNSLLKKYVEYKKEDEGRQYNPLLAGIYMGYVAGYGDGLRGLLICPPNNAIRSQTFLIVGNFLEAHPERLHESQEALVLEALMTAFPCPKNKK